MGIEVRVFVSRSAPSRRSAWTTEIPDVDITVPTILLGTGLAGLIVTAAIWIPRPKRPRNNTARDNTASTTIRP